MLICMNALVVCCLAFLPYKYVDAIIHNGVNRYQKPMQRIDNDVTISKVTLTQNGYIQFLRYINEVPPLIEYTFCIWVNSRNLTHNHPLLSYSKDEKKRLIRVWITPHGTHINLEILDLPIFEIPVSFYENHWYHVCQSWATLKGSWSLFMNGRLKASGYEDKLKGVIIEGGGDIVVGQEYTDFDKGLDDGIEGDIYGFNLVLSSTHPFGLTDKHNYGFKRHPGIQKPNSSGQVSIYSKQHKNTGDLQLELHQQEQSQLFGKTLPRTYEDQSSEENSQIGPNSLPTVIDAPRLESPQSVPNAEVPDVLHYFSNYPNRNPKGIMNIFDGVFNYFQPNKIRIPLYRKVVPPGNSLRRFSAPAHNVNDINEERKTLGQLLVELSFNCALRKGAPLKGRDVLINWTESPVRVFGGAILKTIRPFCV